MQHSTINNYFSQNCDIHYRSRVGLDIGRFHFLSDSLNRRLGECDMEAIFVYVSPVSSNSDVYMRVLNGTRRGRDNG